MRTAPGSSTTVSRIRRGPWWPLGLLAVLLVVGLVYAPTINDYFGGDDFLVIGPVRAVGAWELIWKSVVLRDNIPYWRPLVSPLYALEVHGFGLRPWAWHLVAVGLHLVNVALLAAVARALTGRSGVALAAALLFGVHAAHTTTVAQISSTVELLSVVWYFSTVLLAVRAVLPPKGEVVLPLRRNGRYWGAVACFALALLSKESTASAAGVLTVLFALFVYLPAQRRDGQGTALRLLMSYCAPFWLLVLPYIVFTYITDTDDPTGIIKHMYFFGPHMPANLWWFLGRLATPLTPGYGPDQPPWAMAGALVAATAMALVLVRGRYKDRFLVLWTLLALMPLAPWRTDLLLGRFTYQAAAPFAILMATAGVAASGGVTARVATARHVGRSRLWGPAAFIMMLSTVTLLFAVLTWRQNQDRGREGDDYRLLVQGLLREAPELPDGSTVVMLDGIWTGPFHALYLNAVADTLYGQGRVSIVNVEPGHPPPNVAGAAFLLRFSEGKLLRDASRSAASTAP